MTFNAWCREHGIGRKYREEFSKLIQTWNCCLETEYDAALWVRKVHTLNPVIQEGLLSWIFPGKEDEYRENWTGRKEKYRS